MNKKCIAAVPTSAEEIRQSKMLFKKEWTQILMNAEETDGAMGARYHFIKGELIELFADKGIISLDCGIMVSLPLCCIRLME